MAEDQRLIDVNEAIFQIEARERVAIPDTDGKIRISTKAFKQFLRNQIVIDPVKHGHWISDGDKTLCSNCREDIPTVCVEPATFDNLYGDVREIDKTPFCPNCGAKMDEEVE